MCIKIKTETNDQGCHLVVSHRLNQDGYFRKNVGGKLQMYHRYVYESEVGEIPEGFEIDHMCRNRSCINPEHLQALSRNDHLVKTNQERYADRKQEALEYWLIHKSTGVALAEKFEVCFGSACKWIRQWKEITNGI
jgi:hypothetical protein